MGIRFRRSIKVAPGVKLNLGKNGVSVSAGVRGARMTVGKTGSRITTGIPGTGLSETHLIKSGSAKSEGNNSLARKMQALSEQQASKQSDLQSDEQPSIGSRLFLMLISAIAALAVFAFTDLSWLGWGLVLLSVALFAGLSKEKNATKSPQQPDS